LDDPERICLHRVDEREKLKSVSAEPNRIFDNSSTHGVGGKVGLYHSVRSQLSRRRRRRRPFPFRRNRMIVCWWPRAARTLVAWL
jgi:hypothetical protein